MCVTFALVAAIALSIGFAATSAEQTSLSKKTSMGLVNSIDALDEANNKRFLRSHREPEDEDVEDSDDDEERGISVSAEQLKKLITGHTRDMFAGWRKQRHEPSVIRDKFEELYKSGHLTKEQYKDIARWYHDGHRR